MKYKDRTVHEQWQVRKRCKIGYERFKRYILCWWVYYNIRQMKGISFLTPAMIEGWYRDLKTKGLKKIIATLEQEFGIDDE